MITWRKFRWEKLSHTVKLPNFWATGIWPVLWAPALHQNPDGSRFPCYKVVSAQGKLARSYAFGGLPEQKRRLEREGIRVENDRVDLEKYQWDGES